MTARAVVSSHQESPGVYCTRSTLVELIGPMGAEPELSETVGQLWHLDLVPVHAVSVDQNRSHGAHQHH